VVVIEEQMEMVSFVLNVRMLMIKNILLNTYTQNARLKSGSRGKEGEKT